MRNFLFFFLSLFLLIGVVTAKATPPDVGEFAKATLDLPDLPDLPEDGDKANCKTYVTAQLPNTLPASVPRKQSKRARDWIQCWVKS